MGEITLIFSHTNYLKVPNGTEKCIRELEAELNKEQCYILQVFPLVFGTFAPKDSSTVGVNFNKEFLGIYKLLDIPYLFESICKKKNQCKGMVQIHNLKGYNLDELQTVLVTVNRPVIFWIHDFLTVCNQYFDDTVLDKQCVTEKLNDEKCRYCKCYQSGKSYQKSIRHFFHGISHLLYRIMAPSHYAKKIWEIHYPSLSEKIYIRPHLIPDQKRYRKVFAAKEQINIAYVGTQIRGKGYDVWKEIVREAAGRTDLQFHYFGNGNKQLDYVSSHYVSTSLQGENAMVESLRTYNADICIFWGLLPETYSYVFFELLCSGVFILCSESAGNVCNLVKQYKNGIVFNSTAQLKEYLDNTDGIRESLICFYNNIDFPIKMNTNKDIKCFLSEDEIYVKKTKAVKRCNILTAKYIIRKNLLKN